MFYTGLTEWTPGTVILRIFVSLVLGALIGIDRGAKKRGGGGRTDAAVCSGAALIMLTAQYMELVFPDKADIARLAAQVISGVGFLGAGSILVSGHQVKGLTSAAGIWICACVGLATGAGFVDGAIVMTVMLLVMLHIIPMIEEKLYQHTRYVRLYVEAEESRAAAMLLHKMRQDGCKIDMYDMEQPGAAGLSCTILVTVHIPKKYSRDEYLESLREIDEILFVDTM